MQSVLPLNIAFRPAGHLAEGQDGGGLKGVGQIATIWKAGLIWQTVQSDGQSGGGKQGEVWGSCRT